MKRSGRPPDTNASNQTSASHCRRDGRVLKIFDWPATRSVYVAIRDEVKRKMADARPPRLFTFNYLDTAPHTRFAEFFLRRPRTHDGRPGRGQPPSAPRRTTAGPLVCKT